MYQTPSDELKASSKPSRNSRLERSPEAQKRRNHRRTVSRNARRNQERLNAAEASASGSDVEPMTTFAHSSDNSQDFQGHLDVPGLSVENAGSSHPFQHTPPSSYGYHSAHMTGAGSPSTYAPQPIDFPASDGLSDGADYETNVQEWKSAQEKTQAYMSGRGEANFAISPSPTRGLNPYTAQWPPVPHPDDAPLGAETISPAALSASSSPCPPSTDHQSQYYPEPSPGTAATHPYPAIAAPQPRGPPVNRAHWHQAGPSLPTQPSFGSAADTGYSGQPGSVMMPYSQSHSESGALDPAMSSGRYVQPLSEGAPPIMISQYPDDGGSYHAESYSFPRAAYEMAGPEGAGGTAGGACSLGGLASEGGTQADEYERGSIGELNADAEPEDDYERTGRGTLPSAVGSGRPSSGGRY